MWDTGIHWEEEGTERHSCQVLYQFVDGHCIRVGDVHWCTYWWGWRQTDGEQETHCRDKNEAMLGLLRTIVPNLDDVLAALEAAAIAGEIKTVVALARQHGVPTVCVRCGKPSGHLQKELDAMVCHDCYWKNRHGAW
jgi:hypothetical protein